MNTSLLVFPSLRFGETQLVDIRNEGKLDIWTLENFEPSEKK
jgi:hypothetical protein